MEHGVLPLPFRVILSQHGYTLGRFQSRARDLLIRRELFITSTDRLNSLPKVYIRVGFAFGC